MISAKKIIGLPIMSLAIRTPLAKISQVVIDPDTGWVFGLLATTPWLLKKNYFIDVSKILNFFNDAVLIPTPEDLWEPQEVIRVENIIRSKNFILGKKVVTEAGLSLGQCVDFQINPENNYLWAITAKKLFTTREFPREKIIKINLRQIIVQNLETIKEKSAIKIAAKVAARE